MTDPAGAGDGFEVGSGRREIEIEPRGYAMSGYGMTFHRATWARTPLFARAIVVAAADGRRVAVCCIDLAMVTHALRQAAEDELGDVLGDGWSPERFVLNCTHSHSSPGGCGHEAMYNWVTPGFVPEHHAAVIEAVVGAVRAAWDDAGPSTLTLERATFATSDEVAWNRALRAHVRNPEAVHRSRSETHLAVDREMAVLSVRRDDRVDALLSLFGVHATCIGNHLEAHDGDNKGRAARRAEQALADGGADEPVAIFAQATAGDVSPHFHGPGQTWRRRAVRRDGDADYAERNGALQADLALAAVAQSGPAIDGPVDGVMAYVDLSDIEVPAWFADGLEGARTVDPCHGAAFFAGTPVDGRGMPRVAAVGARLLARWVRRRRLAHDDGSDEARYHRALYAAQDPKDVVMESGTKRNLGTPLRKVRLPDAADPAVAQMKKEARSGALDESPLVPTVLPVQLIRLGGVVIVCCPGEFTTIAGRRIRETVSAALEDAGAPADDVLLMTYANDYMGYVTTPEEYAEQTYEGGHTIFGRWTLGALQATAAELARQLARPGVERSHDADRRPPPIPSDELALRASLPPRSA